VAPDRDHGVSLILAATSLEATAELGWWLMPAAAIVGAVTATVIRGRRTRRARSNREHSPGPSRQR
jgi:hypothetical protein